MRVKEEEKGGGGEDEVGGEGNKVTKAWKMREKKRF